MGSGEQRHEGEALALTRRFFPEQMDMVDFVRSGGQVAFGQDVPIAPDFQVEFLPRALGPDLSGSGLTGMVEAWRQWLEPYDSYLVEVEGFEELTPEEVLVRVAVRARTHRDGVLVEHTPAAVATIRDGTLVRLRFHLDRDMARADAARRADREPGRDG